GSLDATVECSDAAALANAQAAFPIASDLCDADVTNIVKTSGEFVPAQGCTNAGTYTNTWTVTDACGNTSAVFTQVITVQDTTAPTWSTGPLSLNTTVECSDAQGLANAQALAPVAFDTCDVDITNIVKTSGEFVPSQTCASGGTYINTWVAYDSCGNASNVFTQVITIQDSTAPTWTTLINSLNTTVECSDAAGLATAQALAPTATDNCSNVTYVKTSGVFVAGTCPSSGTYTNMWRAIDACGNTSPWFTQVITVQDTTAPTMTSQLAPVLAVTCDNIPDAPQPQFSDNCSVITSDLITFTETTSATVNNQYHIIRTWSAQDACGNQSQTYTQDVTVTITTQTTSVNASRICSAGTQDNTVDLNTYLSQEIPTGGTWINESNVGTLTGSVFNGLDVADGTYVFSYNYTEAGNTCPQKINVNVPVEVCIVEGCDAVLVHNAFTPNGDGVNEYFQIDYINQKCHLPNRVEIYNRWGVLVFEADNYDNENVGKVFTGVSEGRSTVSKSDELPAGTYFYIMQYSDSDSGKTITESSYLYLTR
ncbi:gliding motility-associated C-terminal domain-containing protein, partial [Flavobacterium sp. XGLA_31]|uniref:gliding motility-associated C-terminal domain-containing protein n=1 Tax=Flavobacterium sp. XGLA_31 TaxID=3447666 RepID=UPI003F3D21F3